MCRIKHNMTIEEMIAAISGGIPGTIECLAIIHNVSGKIDPENGIGIHGYLFTMDICEVYDNFLWTIFANLCDKNIVKTIAILRALQLGVLTSEEIKYFLSNKEININFFSLITQIRGILGNFAPGYEM